MRLTTIPRLAAGLTLLLAIAVATRAVAFPSLARSTKMSCQTCHANASGGADLTDAGKAYKADNTKVPAASVAGNSYLGSGACKMCHMTEYKSWQTTPHARAIETLRTATPEKVAEISAKLGVKLTGPADQSAECLQCHVTGHGMEGGYPGADSTKTASLAAVTCENCHGPGSAHKAAAREAKKAAINGRIGENFCRDCHTPTMSPKFDFATYQAKGLHEKKAPAE
jgi:hypothetical protein